MLAQGLCAYPDIPAKPEASFPWPYSPGQGKINLLCGLRVSVVKPSYTAQEIPKIDVEIVAKGHLWMETNH